MNVWKEIGPGQFKTVISSKQKNDCVIYLNKESVQIKDSRLMVTWSVKIGDNEFLNIWFVLEHTYSIQDVKLKAIQIILNTILPLLNPLKKLKRVTLLED